MSRNLSYLSCIRDTLVKYQIYYFIQFSLLIAQFRKGKYISIVYLLILSFVGISCNNEDPRLDTMDCYVTRITTFWQSSYGSYYNDTSYWEFTYDTLNRITRVAYQDFFDGLHSSNPNRKGSLTIYDPIWQNGSIKGMLVKIDGLDIREVSIFYDNNLVSKIVGVPYTYNFSYDSDLRIYKVDQILYEYNSYGNIKTQNYNSGFSIYDYTYDDNVNYLSTLNKAFGNQPAISYFFQGIRPLSKNNILNATRQGENHPSLIYVYEYNATGYVISEAGETKAGETKIEYGICK